DLLSAVLAEIRRENEGISARMAKADVGDHLRADRPVQADGYALRAAVARAASVIERSFGQTGQRRGAEYIRIDEAVASEQVETAVEIVVNACVELILPRARDRRGHEVVTRPGQVRIRDQVNDLRADRIEANCRDRAIGKTCLLI